MAPSGASPRKCGPRRRTCVRSTIPGWRGHAGCLIAESSLGSPSASTISRTTSPNRIWPSRLASPTPRSNCVASSKKSRLAQEYGHRRRDLRSTHDRRQARHGPRRLSRVVFVGGLLAVSLFGIALGIGLSSPKSDANVFGWRVVAGAGIGSSFVPIPAAVARACHVDRNLRNETAASVICVVSHLGTNGGGVLRSRIQTTRIRILRSFNHPSGHGTGSVTITATRYRWPRRISTKP